MSEQYYVVCRTYVGPNQAECTDKTHYYVTKDRPTYPSSPWGPVAEGSGYTHGEYATTLCGIWENLESAKDHAKDLASQEDDTNPGYREFESPIPDWWLFQYRPGALQPMSPEGTRQWCNRERKYFVGIEAMDPNDAAEAVYNHAGTFEGCKLDMPTVITAVAGWIADAKHAASDRWSA